MRKESNLNRKLLLQGKTLLLTEKEIIHNVMISMVAGYDTSSGLLTFIMRFLANEPAIYAAVVQGKQNP